MRRQSTSRTTPRHQRQGDRDFQQQAKRDADRRAVQRRKDRRHDHGRAKARETPHHACNAGDGGADQEGKSQQIGHRGRRR